MKTHITFRRPAAVLTSAALLLLATPLGAATGTVRQAQYRIDQGTAQTMTLDSSGSRTEYWQGAFTANVDSSGLSTGPHWLEVRMQGSNDVWSNWQGRWIRVNGQPTLTGGEWFLDTDPGPGNGTPIAAPADGAWDEAEEKITLANIDSSAFTVGQHTFFVRTRDSDGNWGLTNQATIYVASPMTVVAAEMTMNPSAAPGTGTALTATDGAFDEVEEALEGTFPSSLAGNTLGQSATFYVRVRDSLGRWSTRKGNFWNGTTGKWEFNPATGWNGESITTFIVSPDTVYANWLAAHFTPQEIAAGVITQPGADPDQDGLSNSEECARLTDPRNRDTDGDLIPDGVEVANGWNPLAPTESSISDGVLASLRARTQAMADHDLYTLDSIRSIHVGDPLIEVNHATGQVTLDLQLQSSDDLQSWSPFGSAVHWTDTAKDKAFYRLHFGSQP